MARLIVFTLWAVGVLLAAGPAAAFAGSFEQHGSTRLIDLPYLSQSEDLCGGAAIAILGAGGGSGAVVGGWSWGFVPALASAFRLGRSPAWCSL